jgi:apolipoprotein N-acyltransferase
MTCPGSNYLHGACKLREDNFLGFIYSLPDWKIKLVLIFSQSSYLSAGDNFTLAPALIFAGIIMLTRSTALKLNTWYSLFAFPLFFTAFEYILIKFAPDGTAASIAYSQMNCLPLIQIAAVAGSYEICFDQLFLGWRQIYFSC